MTIKKIATLILFGLGLLEMSAQDTFIKSSNETKELSQKVTQLFKEGKISNGISALKPYWPIPEKEVDALEEKSVKYLSMVESRFGKPESILKVKEETIKDLAIRETYFIRYEYTAVRMIFTYYKNEKGWIVNAFKWDDNFTEEFK